MPRTTPTIQDTTLTYQRDGQSRSLTVDSPDWYRWLDDATTLAFVGRHGAFTARKEPASNGRGGWYWRAYRKHDGALLHHYLGRSADLTLKRLQAAAAALGQRSASPSEPADGGARPAGALRPLTRWSRPLPEPLSSFVGRAAEMAEVSRLLATTRLLTLTGAGGCGKTRLALRVAAEWRATHSDAVCLVDLASLADPDLVAQAVAAALGIAEIPTRPLLDTLVDALRRHRLLLVLDNCEHLIDACAALADRLPRAAPALRILATSRAPIGVAGEVAWRVPPLAAAEAVALFVERAVAVRPGFRLIPENSETVTRICRRLDGIPLAIELAAVRAAVLSPEDIAARLDDSLRLLTTGNRTAQSRHRTLRATLDWSYDLLSAPERAVFRRLAVFAGGWTLAAAEEVCADGNVVAAAMLDLLSGLIGKSLVQAEPTVGDGMRYRLLETVRQYAWERLREAGEEEVVQNCHAARCLALAERVEPQLLGGEQRTAYAVLDAERDNLRAALAWRLARDPEAGQRLAVSLQRYWYARGGGVEGMGWFRALLAASPARTLARVRALHGAGLMAMALAARTEGVAYFVEAAALARERGEPGALAWALRDAGFLLLHMGEYERAEPLLAEAQALARVLGDVRGLGSVLKMLAEVAIGRGDLRQAKRLAEEGMAQLRVVGDGTLLAFGLLVGATATLGLGEADLARALVEEALALTRASGASYAAIWAWWHAGDGALWQGDFERAAACYEAGLGLAREAADAHSLGRCLAGLGRVALRRGDVGRAVELLEEALAHARRSEDRPGQGAILLGLALAAHRRAEPARAWALLAGCLTLRRAMGQQLGIAEGLEGLAIVAVAGGRWAPSSAGRRPPAGILVQAARLLGAAGAIRTAIGAPLPPVERPDHEAVVQATRAELGEASFGAAWAAGQAMTPDEAVAAALVEDGSATVAAGSTADSAVAPRVTGRLTRREVEVLRLVAAGRSNREIAGDLALSVRTVERHITNLYGKLDARGRADATAYAIRHGLA